jgi:tetratricopeptide (TPR) repeat protein
MSLGKESKMGRWILACAVSVSLTAAPVAFGQAAAGTGAKPAAATPAGNAAATAANKTKNTDALLQQGIDALSAGQYQAAREAFQDAAALDPRNAKAQHGLALCMMAQKEVAKAAAVLDKGLAATPNPDRAMVLNGAASHMAVRGNMRAAKILKEYLEKHPKDADEPMVNALGTALQSATAQER